MGRHLTAALIPIFDCASPCFHAPFSETFSQARYSICVHVGLCIMLVFQVRTTSNRGATHGCKIQRGRQRLHPGQSKCLLPIMHAWDFASRHFNDLTHHLHHLSSAALAWLLKAHLSVIRIKTLKHSLKSPKHTTYIEWAVKGGGGRGGGGGGGGGGEEGRQEEMRWLYVLLCICVVYTWGRYVEVVCTWKQASSKSETSKSLYANLYYSIRMVSSNHWHAEPNVQATQIIQNCSTNHGYIMSAYNTNRPPFWYCISCDDACSLDLHGAQVGALCYVRSIDVSCVLCLAVAARKAHLHAHANAECQTGIGILHPNAICSHWMNAK